MTAHTSASGITLTWISCQYNCSVISILTNQVKYSLGNLLPDWWSKSVPWQATCNLFYQWQWSWWRRKKRGSKLCKWVTSHITVIKIPPLIFGCKLILTQTHSNSGNVNYCVKVQYLWGEWHHQISPCNLALIRDVVSSLSTHSIKFWNCTHIVGIQTLIGSWNSITNLYNHEADWGAEVHFFKRARLQG